MKVTQKSQIGLLFLAFFFVETVNWYLSVVLLINSFQGYFIVFLVLFLLDKIITWFITYDKCNEALTIEFMLLDLLSLSYFSIRRNDLTFSNNTFLVTKMFFRCYPLAISQMIFFFGQQILASSTLTQLTISLSYLNYFLLIGLTGLMCSQIIQQDEKFQIRKTLVSLFNHLSYYTSLSQLMLMKDSKGINIGIYYICVIGFNLLFNLITLETDQEYKQINVLYFFMGNLMNYQVYLDQDNASYLSVNQSEIQNPLILSSGNQLTRLILVLCFIDYHKLSISSRAEIIQLSNLLTTIITSVGFFISILSILNTILLKWKWMRIKCISSYTDISDRLKEKGKNLKKVFILQDNYIQLQCEGSKIRNSNNSMLGECNMTTFKILNQETHADYGVKRYIDYGCIYYNLQQCISELLKKKIIIVYEDRFERMLCECEKIRKLFVEEPYILKHNLRIIKSTFRSDIHNIIIERIERGFLFTPFTKLLMVQFCRDFQLEHKYFSQFLTASLNITVYMSYIESEMLMNSKFILLDLYF